MRELLNHFSVTEIIVFICLLALAIKEVITFLDWASDRLKKHFNKGLQEQLLEDDRLDIDEDKIEKLEQAITEITNLMTAQSQQIQLLLDSDRDDIKAWITQQHHFFCYEQRYIDDYSLDCLERRFKHYQAEGGNSYAETLMNEIRALPKVSANIKNHK